MQLLCWWLLERIPNMAAETKKITSHRCFFWAVKFDWRWCFRNRGAYFLVKWQSFKFYSFRKWKSSFSQTLTKTKKRNEKSFQSNPVKVNDFKVHFFTFAKVFERYLLSLAFYGMFATDEMKILRENSQPFCWTFLGFFNSFWSLGKKFLAGVSNLQSKCTLEHFEQSLCSTNKTFFWKFLPISSKKTSYF